MWLIVGTAPDNNLGLVMGEYQVKAQSIVFATGESLPIERGTSALAGAAFNICKTLNKPTPQLLIAGDLGKGDGSRAAYKYLVDNLKNLKPKGITFHYLFPDIDWHNRILMAIEELEVKPILVADAGFMYVAKMSGYAECYDIFTPDEGELAFLADETAPHPVYTRGFLIDANNDAKSLLARAYLHKNIAKYTILKGSTDYIVKGQNILATITTPSVKYMEAIGGTGDIVTGFTTGLLAAGLSLEESCICGAQACRNLAALANPTPATQIAELLSYDAANFLPTEIYK